MTSDPIIDVENLLQDFGAVHAVRGVSFQVGRGRVVGFIGANGAGKTSTMRILATLNRPSGGRVRIAGQDVMAYPRDVRRLLGWMPDHFGAYPNMDVADYLDFFARAHDLRGAQRRHRVRDVLDFTGLTPLARRPSDHLSKGESQRLSLARTLLHDPAVLILDEPAAGLDPKARVEFKNLVRLLASQGKSFFISSHILSELAEMCDSLLFIDHGRIIHHGLAETLRYDERALLAVQVRIDGPTDILVHWVSLQKGVRIREEQRQGAILELEGKGDEALRNLAQRLFLDGVPVVEFHRVQQRLEEAFIGILRTHQATNPPTAPRAAPAKTPAAPAAR